MQERFLLPHSVLIRMNLFFLPKDKIYLGPLVKAQCVLRLSKQDSGMGRACTVPTPTLPLLVASLLSPWSWCFVSWMCKAALVRCSRGLMTSEFHPLVVSPLVHCPMVSGCPNSLLRFSQDPLPRKSAQLGDPPFCPTPRWCELDAHTLFLTCCPLLGVLDKHCASWVLSFRKISFKIKEQIWTSWGKLETYLYHVLQDPFIIFYNVAWHRIEYVGQWEGKPWS